MPPTHGSDPVALIERALAEHENKDQGRHNQLLEQHGQMRETVAALTKELEKDTLHLRELIDNHHMSLYGDGSDHRPGVVAKLDRLLERRKLSARAMVAIWSGIIAVAGLALTAAGVVWGK